MMRRPGIAALSSNQRKELITEIEKGISSNSTQKILAVEALNFCDDLIEEIRSSKITMPQLKKILEEKSEQIKKSPQNY
jgi:hypothetical protein